MAASWWRSSVSAWKLRGKQNLAAWAVAGGLAYYLWIKPEKDAKLAKLRAQPGRDTLDDEPPPLTDRTMPPSRARPLPDPQVGGLNRRGHPHRKVKDVPPP